MIQKMLIYDLSNVPWDLLDINEDSNLQLEKALLGGCKWACSIKEENYCENKPCPWLHPSIKKLAYHRDHLKKKPLKTGSYSLFKSYKTARNKVNVAIKKAKKDYVQQR